MPPQDGATDQRLRLAMIVDRPSGTAVPHPAGRVLLQAQTRRHTVEIIDTEDFGRIAIIDGHLQSASRDEHVYHESFVHPALTAHHGPRNALVIGGSDGALAREVLRHPTIESVTMVDHDEQLATIARRYLAAWNDGAFGDHRLRLHDGDGLDFIADASDGFDAIILDTDDTLHGPDEALFTPPFYRAVQRRLNPGGVLVVQAMECSIGSCADHAAIRHSLKRVFPYVSSYCEFIPSFRTEWGFAIASGSIDIAALGGAEVDLILKRRRLHHQLRHYDGEAHDRMFSLPKDLRLALDRAGQ